ncbi:MAG TPA: AMP-binding protein [Caulobacteraceae bacterium]|jgi:acyl-coenzyme A synthetase/AMP-(fatty) acid ligase
MDVLRTIHATAAATPDKLAVGYNGEPVSYARFWRLIHASRRDLAGRGIPRGGLVLLQVGHLLDGWVLNLALRSLGFEVAAVGPEPDFLAMFDDRDISAVVTVAAEAQTPLAPSGAMHLSLPSPSATALKGERLPPFRMKGPFGAHLMLTSGVTGAPKPVLTRAGETGAALASVLELARGLDTRLASQGEREVACLFDLALWTASGYSFPILAWTLRAAVVLDQRGETHLALQWPGLTRATLTPYFLKRILDAPEGAFPFQPGLRLVVWSGAVTRRMLAEARRRITPTIVSNVASTEVGLWASTPLDSDDDLIWSHIVPTQRVEVVDEQRRPLPPGRLGEVRIALAVPGAGSHLGDAETTAAQYPGGWFYPGDLGIFDERGRLSLRGRATDVVNLDGAKIPVEPWERQLQEALGCEAVCILVGHFGGADDALHMFVESAAPIPLERLSKATRETLGGWGAQVEVHKLAAMPRTPLGKIHRIALAQQLDDALTARAA